MAIHSSQGASTSEPTRPPFDPNIWQYDEAKDEFINTKTGETRAEADFTWPEPIMGEGNDSEEWDTSQSAPDDTDQSGGNWNDSQVRSGRRK